MCEVFRDGILGRRAMDVIIPNQVLAPPTTQLIQFRHGAAAADRRADQADQPGPAGAAADQHQPADRPVADARHAAGFAGAAAAAARRRRPRRRNPQQHPAAQRDALPHQRGGAAGAGRTPRRRSIQQIAQQLGLTLITQQNLELDRPHRAPSADRRRPLGARRHPRAGGEQHRRGGAAELHLFAGAAGAGRDRAVHREPRRSGAVHDGQAASQRRAPRRVGQQHHRRRDRLRGRSRARRTGRHDLAAVRRHRLGIEGALARHRDGRRHRVARPAARRRAGREDPRGARLQRNVRAPPRARPSTSSRASNGRSARARASST